MLQNITYYQVLGIPLIVYIGISTIGLFVVTASLALLKRRGKLKMSIEWHYRLAYLSIFFGIIHGILGLLAYV